MPHAWAGAEADLSATLRSGRDDKVVVKKKTADPLRVGVPVRRSLPERGEAMTERKAKTRTRAKARTRARARARANECRCAVFIV